MKDGFWIRVCTEGDVAVYQQIENHVQFAIASGRLKSGETLPSVRDLAHRLRVNPNTVTKAMRDLELRGLVTTRRGIGMTVSDNARARCKATVHQMVRGRLRDAVGECVAAGFTTAQVKKLVDEALRSGHQPYGS